MKKLLFLLLCFHIGILSSAQNNLDLMGLPSTHPQAAYGLRQLSGDYTGPAVMVRRTSDNLEVAVGFDNSTEKVVSGNSLCPDTLFRCRSR